MKNFFELCLIRARAAKRLAMWHTLSNRLPIYLVPEFPKSGGTWFSQMLAEAMDLPFYRNTSAQPIKSCVMSGHHMYSPHFKNVVIVIRDGRDCVVSAYYYMCFKNNINRQFGVDRYRSHLQFEDYDDIQVNLPRFIEYLFGEHAEKRFHFGWGEFIDAWMDKDVPVVKYEDLLVTPGEELKKTVEALSDKQLPIEKAKEIAANYSFKKMSGRKPGEENKGSFVRKGVAGDWKNHFTREARLTFDRIAGDQLIKAGYEPNRDWLEHDTIPQSDSVTSSATS